MLRLYRFVTYFMGILPIIFTFSGGNIADSYHDFGKIMLFHTKCSSESLHFFVFHGNNIA